MMMMILLFLMVVAARRERETTRNHAPMVRIGRGPAGVVVSGGHGAFVVLVVVVVS